MAPQLTVLLENIRSAYNVGSIFRTCDAAGVARLYLTGYTAIPPAPKLQKTALGALASVPWEHYCRAEQLVSLLKRQGVDIWACEPLPAAVSIYASPVRRPTCLILGNEVNGISDTLLQAADRIVKVPQFGVKESLNVATAAGIVIYECRRQLLFPNSVHYDYVSAR